MVPVDYENQTELQYALRGTDLVISTISGSPQYNLIDAAWRAEVSRFIPSDYEGPPTRRSRTDPLDRGRTGTLEYLRTRPPMRFTVFTCGIFYERFARGGLTSKGIGLSTGISHPGAYLLDLENNTGEVAAAGESIYICMTSVADVAQFLVAALDLGIQTWPSEFRMRGDRLTQTEIVRYAEAVKGTQFIINVYAITYIVQQIMDAELRQDRARIAILQNLKATAEQKYDWRTTNLNALVEDVVQPEPFWDWLYRQWSPPDVTET